MKIFRMIKNQRYPDLNKDGKGSRTIFRIYKFTSKKTGAQNPQYKQLRFSLTGNYDYSPDKKAFFFVYLYLLSLELAPLVCHCA